MAHFDLAIDELRSFRPEVREPEDFDSFWADTLRQARLHDAPVVTAAGPVELERVEIFDVTFPGHGGHPIKAWYARPRGVESELPCVVEVAGYGGGRGVAIEHTLWPSAGFAYLFMDTRGQGSAWGNGGDTPDPVGSGPAAPGFMTQGILDPAEYYYRRVFTDAVRAVDAARALPGVDASRVFFKGASQGGGITLAVAGLVPDLLGVMPDVPFLCHFERATSIVDTFPYGEIVKYLSVHRGADEQVFSTLAYFDGVNFAKRAHSPALFSTGLMDEVCPPSTVFAAFNWYGSIAAPDVRKEISLYGYNGHEGGSGHQGMRQLAFAAEILAVGTS